MVVDLSEILDPDVRDPIRGRRGSGESDGERERKGRRRSVESSRVSHWSYLSKLVR
jgi:hypothetical protein